MGLILADDAELAALNAAHMGKAGPTDVLSFPLLPPEAFPPHAGGAAAAAQPGAGRPGDGPAPGPFLLPPGARLHLGDIVVSVERASRRPRPAAAARPGDVRWARGRRAAPPVAHGALHLCGWDHAEPEEEAAMRALERALLSGPPR